VTRGAERPGARKTLIIGCPRGWVLLTRGRYPPEGDFSARAVRGLKRCHEWVSLYVRRGKVRPVAGVLLSAVVFWNKCVIAWVTAKGLALDVALGKLLAIKVVLTYLLDVFPSPGPSGPAELASTLMAAVVPKRLLSVYTGLWRDLAAYISVGIGGLVVLTYIRAKREAISQNARGLAQERYSKPHFTGC